MPEMDKSIPDGIGLIKAGKKEEGRRLLAAAVQDNPDSEEAWLWLGVAATSPRETISCLKRALAINPRNQKAAAGIKWATTQLEQERRAQLPAVHDTPVHDTPVQDSAVRETGRDGAAAPSSADEIARSVLDSGPRLSSVPARARAAASERDSSPPSSRQGGGMIPNVIIVVLALTLVLGLLVIAYLLHAWLG